MLKKNLKLFLCMLFYCLKLKKWYEFLSPFSVFYVSSPFPGPKDLQLPSSHTPLIQSSHLKIETKRDLILLLGHLPWWNPWALPSFLFFSRISPSTPSNFLLLFFFFFQTCFNPILYWWAFYVFCFLGHSVI